MKQKIISNLKSVRCTLTRALLKCMRSLTLLKSILVDPGFWFLVVVITFVTLGISTGNKIIGRQETELNARLNLYKERMSKDDIDFIEKVCKSDRVKLECWDKERAILNGVYLKKQKEDKRKDD